MAKLAVVFFALLAFQGILADSGRTQQHRNREVQELLKLIQTVGTEASNAVQNVQVENHQNRRVLASQANELAHNVHEAVYHLQQVAHRNHGGQGQEVLHQVINRLSEIVHSVQQSVNHEPSQLKTQLRTQVQNVVVEAQRLGQVVQQEQHSHQINDEVEDVLDDLVAAVQQLQALPRVLAKSQQEVKDQIQTVVNEVSTAVQRVNTEDNTTAEELAHHSHHLAHHVGHIVHLLQREVHNHDGEVQNVLHQVVNKLSEIRASLEQAGLTEETNKVTQLKTELKTNIHNVAVQVERLIQVVYSTTVGDHDSQNLRLLVQNVLLRSLVGARQLQREVEATVQNHQQN